MIKGVVFDADGTLLNSFEVILAAYAHVGALHGFAAPTPAQVREQLSLGKAIPDIYRALFPAGDIEAMIKDNSEFVGANSTAHRVYDGLHDMLSALASRGLKLAILTSGNHRIHTMLAQHDAEKYFSSIVHCERVAAYKPDPEGFLLAAAELHLDPSQLAMVGDTPVDVMTGKNGGAGLTIGLTHGNSNRQALQATDADYVVDSLAECAAVLLKA